MLTELLGSTNLFHLLHRIDIDLADQQQKGGCPFCGSSLHHSNYRRKPRCGPTLPESLYIRLSFCCSRENCRRRTLPKSTLFMDRRVYFRVAILIAVTLSQNKPQEYSKNMLSKMLEANRKTVNRWIAYFREIFPASQMWKTVRGFISSAVTNQSLPGSLVEYFLGHALTPGVAIINCLRLLTTGSPTMKTMEQ